MAKYNSSILLIAVIGLGVVVSGCVNSSEPTQKTQGVVPTVNSPLPIQTPVLTSTPIVNQRSSMSFTELYEAMRSSDLTTLQKENLYVNKIFTWTGKVTDVTQDAVIQKDLTGINSLVQVYAVGIQFDECDGEEPCFPVTIWLRVDNDQKPKLNSLIKGSIITFEGTINPNSSPLKYLPTNKKFPTKHIELSMYNGRIIG